MSTLRASNFRGRDARMMSRFGGGFIAAHSAEVEEALIALGVGGSFGGGQQADKFRQQQGRVLHFVFGTTGVDIEPRTLTVAAAALKFSYSISPSSPPSTV